MTSSITKTLRNEFENAALNHVAKKHLRGNEWKAFQELTETFEKKRQQEKSAYRDEYGERVRRTEKYLIDKAGEKKRDFKHRWFGQDKFSRSAIQGQAQKIVRQQHRVHLEALNEQERESKDAFLTRIDRREHLREKMKQDFAQAVDRRSGMDRRRSTPKPAHSRDLV